MRFGWARAHTQCVKGASATSPFDSSTSTAQAVATIDSTGNSGECLGESSHIQFDFYIDSAKTKKIGDAHFKEDLGAEYWYHNGNSVTCYPSEGSYGYAIVVDDGVTKSTFTLTIEAVPPASQTAALIDHGLKKELKAAEGRQNPEVDIINALEVVDAYTNASPGEDQIREMGDFLQPFNELIDAATLAAKNLRASQQGAARLKALEKYVTTGDSSIDVERLTFDLLDSPEFSSVMETASKTTGLVAIGLGVSAHYSLVVPGQEVGAEGIIIFPQTIGNTKTSTEFATRTWHYKTKGADFIVGAGFTISVWLTPPVTSNHVLGAALDLTVPRYELFGAVPTLSDPSLTQVQGKDVLKYASAFLLGIGFSFELGAVFLSGTQKINIKSTSAALSVFNQETATEVVILGVTAVLDVTITYPTMAKLPVTIFRKGETTMKIGMPAYLSDSVNSDSMTVTPPSGWTVEAYPVPLDGSLYLIYTGTDNNTWDKNITFSISNVTNNSDAEVGRGKVSLTMSDFDTTRKVHLDIRAFSSLPLVLQTFTATLKWTVAVDEGFTIRGASSGTTYESGTTYANSPPSTFVQIETDDDVLVQVIDTNGIIWNMGYVFAQISDSPYVQAVWWRDGKSYTSRYLYQSDKTPITATEAQTSAYYDNYSGSKSYLEINATLTATIDKPNQGSQSS